MSEFEIDLGDFTAEEIQRAINGEYGAETQAAVAADLGIEFADEGNGGSWEDNVLAEMARLEQQVGRNLTVAEAKRIATSLKPNGEVPNLVEKPAEELRNRPYEKESRMALMAERAQETIDARNEAQEGWSE